MTATLNLGGLCVDPGKTSSTVLDLDRLSNPGEKRFAFLDDAESLRVFERTAKPVEYTVLNDAEILKVFETKEEAVLFAESLGKIPVLLIQETFPAEGNSKCRKSSLETGSSTS